MHVLWQSNLVPRQIIPSVAFSPAVRPRLVYPADKAIDISQSPRWEWQATSPGAKFDVYLGENAAVVEQATAATKSIYQGQQDETSYIAELEPGKTYYWRIDEVIAGVMFRETPEPGSPMVMCGVRATGQAFLRWRTFANANVAGTVEVPQHPATIVIPHYLRLTRQGSQFRTEHSSDGTTWENVGEPASVSMGQPVYVGLAVSADVADTQAVTNTAVFTSVSTTGTVDAAGPFQSLQDIGMGGNSPLPLYVAVADSAGKTAVIVHPDGPNAVVTNTWTEWLINLNDITGQGVKLTAIRKVTLGIGNRTGAAKSGSGTLYVDDVRLYDGQPLQK